MRQLRLRRLWPLLAVLLILAGFGLNTLRHHEGIAVLITSPEERRQMLEPYWRMVPEGAPDSAGSVLLSGCDGLRDNMDYWGAFLAARGHPALLLDSHRPRGLDNFESWRLLCIGQLLPGSQRAGDLAVAMAVTKRDDMILLGASHGAWTILEFLHLARDGVVPPGLATWPASPSGQLHRVRAAVLLYPYCGLLNGADTGDWTAMPPMLMILGGRDELGVTPECQELAQDLRRRGARIEVILFDEAGHGFDQQDRSRLSALEFDAGLRARALAVVTAFLDRVDP